MVPCDLITQLCVVGANTTSCGRSLLSMPSMGRTHSHDVLVIPGLSGVARYAAFADVAENARTALLERVFYHEIGGVFVQPPVPTPQVVVDTLRPFTRCLSHKVSRLTPVPLAEYPSATYRGRKLAVYQRAADEVARRGSRRSDSYISCFIKFEKLVDGVKRVVPRVIQPRKPRYNVAVGRYIHQLEHTLYRDIDKCFGRPTIMKGLNACDRGAAIAGQWHRYREPVVLSLDASRFDQHVSVPILTWEHQIYDMYYHSAELRNLLSWQLSNRGFVRCGDGGFTYTVKGGRCSGDMNTACGNCLISAGAIFSLLHSVGLTNSSGSMVSVFIDGDDVAIIGERSDVEIIRGVVPAHYERLGFVMKMEPIVDVLEKVSFCQCQPVYDGVAWRMVREVHASVSKDAVLLGTRYSEQQLRYQFDAIGNCGLALTSGLPILQEYYTALVRGGNSGGTPTERFVETGFYRLSRGMHCDVREPSVAARVSFAKAFDIPPDLQLEIERYYRSLDLTHLAPASYGEQDRCIGL